MNKQVKIRPVHRHEIDLERLALALLDVVESLDETTLAALALAGQRTIERLKLQRPQLPRREPAA